MSDTPVSLSDLTEFTLKSGPSFTADVADAYFALRALAREAGREGEPDHETDYLPRVVKLARETYGVELTLGEADAFSDHVGRLYLQKKNGAERRHALHADLAEFYGFSPFGRELTPDEVLGLTANIPRLEAVRTLREARLGRVQLTADGWFDLTMLATGGKPLGRDQLGRDQWAGGDREAAEKAHNDYVRACQKSGVRPEGGE